MRAPSSSTNLRDHGAYFDGQTARPNAVTVNILSEGIQIYGGRAQSLGYWDYEGLRRAPGTNSEAGFNLMHREHPDARLVITDTAIMGQLTNMAPQILERRGMPRGLFHRLLQIGLIVGLIAALIYLAVPMTAHIIASAVPVKWETAWGKSIRKNFTKKLKVCKGKVGVAALNTMTAQLLKTSPLQASEYEITVTVVNFKQQNAFATLGGQIVIFSRLIEKMDGSDELAGVLAHEIAHVIARHPLTHTIETFTTTAFTGNLGSSTSDIGGALALSAYSRTKEAEADQIAEQILRESRISSDGLAAFFQRLQKEQKGGLGGALSLFNSHPELAERAARLKDRGEVVTKPALNPTQWQALRKICD